MEGVGISTQALEDANRKLDALLKILRPAQESFSVSVEHMAAVMAELLRVGDWMRAGLAQNAEGAVAQELDRYRLHLEDLKHLLPGIHAHLLTERVRLKAERAHLEATAAWSRSTHGPSP